MESEPMLTPRGKSPLQEKFSPEEDRTHDAASSRTVSPTHYQRAIPAAMKRIFKVNASDVEKVPPLCVPQRSDMCILFHFWIQLAFLLELYRELALQKRIIYSKMDSKLLPLQLPHTDRSPFLGTCMVTPFFRASGTVSFSHTSSDPKVLVHWCAVFMTRFK